MICITDEIFHGIINGKIRFICPLFVVVVLLFCYDDS